MQYRNDDGEEVTAVQYVAGATLPDGVTLVPIEPEVRPVVEQDQAFMDTGEGEDPNMANYIWIITRGDGTISLCHPTTFEDEYQPIEEGA